MPIHPKSNLCNLMQTGISVGLFLGPACIAGLAVTVHLLYFVVSRLGRKASRFAKWRGETFRRGSRT